MQPALPIPPPLAPYRPNGRGAFLAFAIIALVGGLPFAVGYPVALIFARGSYDASIIAAITALVGLAMGFVGSMGAALASPSGSGHQKLGFLFLAAAFLILEALLFRPYTYYP